MTNNENKQEKVKIDVVLDLDKKSMYVDGKKVRMPMRLKLLTFLFIWIDKFNSWINNVNTRR